MPVEYLTPAIEDSAVEVLALLADQGQRRAPSIADLFVAAAAELAGLTALHLDKDFEVIADITRQPWSASKSAERSSWVQAPRASFHR